MARSYYGDKISKNIIETPEGYIVCKNVPIGRIGWMEYHGHELPTVFNEPGDKVCKVLRTPEEVFNKETMASFEGKPVTNTHPTENLTIDTVSMADKGHIQDIRRDGDFLLGDLYIKDVLLKEEVLNNIKREISCGYDCLWVPLGEGKYEQKEIVGNHVAVVQNGRAGPRVTIQDAKKVKDEVPDDIIEKIKEKTGGKKRMKMTQKMLAALGFKHFAQDADPEEIAHAMEAMQENETNKALFSKTPGSDDEPAPQGGGSEEVMSDLCDKMNQILNRIEQLESREEKQQGNDAENAFAGLEGKLKGKMANDDDEEEIPEQQAGKYEEEEEGPSSKMTRSQVKGSYDDDDDDDDGTDDDDTKDDDDDDDVMDEDVENTMGKENTKYMKSEQDKKRKAKDNEEMFKKAADNAFRKHVKDMKRAILAVEDPKLRNQLAKKFVASVQDARQIGNKKAYGDILNTVNNNKRRSAADSGVRQESMAERAQKAVNAWNKQGAEMRKGGK